MKLGIVGEGRTIGTIGQCEACAPATTAQTPYFPAKPTGMHALGI